MRNRIDARAARNAAALAAIYAIKERIESPVRYADAGNKLVVTQQGILDAAERLWKDGPPCEGLGNAARRLLEDEHQLFEPNGKDGCRVRFSILSGSCNRELFLSLITWLDPPLHCFSEPTASRTLLEESGLADYLTDIL